MLEEIWKWANNQALDSSKKELYVAYALRASQENNSNKVTLQKILGIISLWNKKTARKEATCNRNEKSSLYLNNEMERMST